jgi:SAM-dependent methyltransferase
VNRPAWAPEGIDIDTPSASRLYDYYLGGSHNFAADRVVAEQALAVMPEGPLLAQLNRAFLRRAVRFCVAAGIRQFLDIGSGIPTLGNVHEVAQQAAPDARVVYVDTDPVAVAHSRAILADNPNAAVIQEDLRHPDRIVEHAETRRMLDLDRPTALLLVAVLHFIPDRDDPVGLIGRLRQALVPGSFLVLSHATYEGRPDDAQRITELYKSTANPLTMRDRPAVTKLFEGFDLVDPGVVWAPEWRPDSPDDLGEAPERSGIHVGVGRKS